jgi:acetyl-CoA acyltransferase
MPRSLREVVFVDGVRTPFGKSGPKGLYAETRADDLVIKCIRELLRRNPNCHRRRSKRWRSPPPPRSATRA